MLGLFAFFYAVLHFMCYAWLDMGFDVGDIVRDIPKRPFVLVGSLAPQLRNFARGIDDRPVVPVRAPAKSYSEQETFEQDTTDEAFLDATLRRADADLQELVHTVPVAALSQRAAPRYARHAFVPERYQRPTRAARGDVDVEFAGRAGKAYAILTLDVSKLLLLKDSPDYAVS